jgi:hypothetical protein
MGKIITNLVIHGVKRLADIMLLNFSIIITLTLTANPIAKELIGNMWYYISLFCTLLVIAIWDCIVAWYIEKTEKP